MALSTHDSVDHSSLAPGHEAPSGLVQSFRNVKKSLSALLDEKIPQAERKDASESLKRLTRGLDDSYLRLSIWSEDIIQERKDTDVSISDALELLEFKATMGAAKAKKWLEGMESALIDLMDTETSTDEAFQKFSECLSQLESTKSLLKPELIDILGKEVKACNFPDEKRAALSVLCLDGGGIRSYSSLLVLRALMQKVNEIHQNSAQTKYDVDVTIEPHQLFHYVFGTSSGGLVAIMLGRLKMPIEACIDNFKLYCGEAFGNPRFYYRILGQRVGSVIGTKYSEKHIIRATRAVIGSYDPHPEGEKWKRNIFSSSETPCKTVDPGSPDKPHLFRSYRPAVEDFHQSMPHKDIIKEEYENQIWEVVRAASAAPTYFKPMKIGNSLFRDGGFLYNNPAEEAYYEVLNTSNASSFALVSIGSGTKAGSIKRQSSMPVTAVYNLVQEAIHAATDTEKAHRRVDQLTRTEKIPYFRFSVPDLNLKLDDLAVPGSFWRKGRQSTFEMIEELAKEYLSREHVSNSIRAAAQVLIEHRRCQKRQDLASTLNVRITQEVKPDDNWRLIKAAADGNVKVVQEFLGKGGDINSNCYDGVAPLLAAVKNDHLEVAELILSETKQVDFEDQDGWTSLMWAARKGNSEMVHLLLGKNANINHRSHKAWTALIVAAKHGHDEVVKILLSRNADADEPTREGWNATSLALHAQHPSVVKLLDARSRSWPYSIA